LNPGTELIVNLLGGVALLLWGVRMVRTGVLRAYGDRLARFIEQRLQNRMAAFIAGGAATLLLQSSTATALIVTGLAGSGLMSAATGLAVLLGADAGSAIVSSVFAAGGQFVAWASPLLLFAGYVTFSASSEFRPHNIGRILIGLGLVLLALKLVISSTAPLREASLFHQVLTTVGGEPLLALIIGAAVTWLSHSSLAIILLITSFVANGSLEIAPALSLILGVNLGGGLPALTATAGQPREARRLPIANLLVRAALAIVASSFVTEIAILLGRFTGYAPVQAVSFHAAFNIVLGLLFLPLTGPIMTLVKKALPDAAAPNDLLAEPRYLDPAALTSPALALSNAQQETTRMAELLERMFETATEALHSGSMEALKLLRGMDKQLNGYQQAIHGYLAELAGQELDRAEGRRALDIMLYVSNLEHAGDIIQLNMSDRIKAKTKESIVFSNEQNAAIDELSGIVKDSLRLATSVLASGDISGARRLIEQKGTFRVVENAIIDRHLRHDRVGKGKSLRHSALFVDLVRDLHSINTHVVSAAYPIVEEAGLLRDTRLRPRED
jgi:phosphate:Na+ symporter